MLDSRDDSSNCVTFLIYTGGIVSEQDAQVYIAGEEYFLLGILEL